MPRNVANSRATGPKATAPLPDEYKPDGKRKRATNANGRIHHRIVDAVCDILRENGIYDPANVPLLAVRVREWLEATGDSAQVEFVFTEIARQRAERFIVLRDLSPGTVEYFKYALDIPDGAWEYALWSVNCGDDKKRFSAEHWIGRWKDKLDVIDPAFADKDGDILHFRSMLEKLKTEKTLEEIEW